MSHLSVQEHKCMTHLSVQEHKCMTHLSVQEHKCMTHLSVQEHKHQCARRHAVVGTHSHLALETIHPSGHRKVPGHTNPTYNPFRQEPNIAPASSQGKAY